MDIILEFRIIISFFQLRELSTRWAYYDLQYPFKLDNVDVFCKAFFFRYLGV